jgi:hypothetical protein
MTIEELVRGLCRVLLAAQNYEAVIRLTPRLKEAERELSEQLAIRDEARSRVPAIRGSI